MRIGKFVIMVCDKKEIGEFDRIQASLSVARSLATRFKWTEYNWEMQKHLGDLICKDIDEAMQRIENVTGIRPFC